MKKSLVIVESPAKSKTLEKFLGKDFEVVPSMGHLIDLPSSGMGIDVEHGFKPKYIVISSRKKILTGLKQKAKDKSVIYLATDPDREGEAISWHLSRELVTGDKEGLRVEFHEITKKAIEQAFKNPRQLDMNKVNAQQARRVLDRIVGYSLSPLLWKKVGKGLSAGRVQSVALRIIVEREKEINAFISQEYWEIEAQLKEKKGDKSSFIAKLNQVDGKKPQIKTQEEAEELVALLSGREFVVIDVKEQNKSKMSAAPYKTSTMQQDAFNKLRFAAGKTMKVAQQLYEGLEIGEEGSAGLITYMRTDSVKIAQEAQDEAREYIEKTFGKNYVPAQPPKPKSGQLAQEAHEAIRPTSAYRLPKDIKQYLTVDQFKLYELIWKRFIQSQMTAAQMKLTTVDISARPRPEKADTHIFRVSGTVILFDGFLIINSEPEEPKEEEAEVKEKLPALVANEILDLQKIISSQHFTKPPARFSDASLVKELEENGIGRPSTYAPIISTIVERDYVERKSGYLYPTELGIIVTDLLVKHFPEVLNVSFTAEMETELDKVEEGAMAWEKVLHDFYPSFAGSLTLAQEKMEDVKKTQVETDYVCELCNKPMVFRWSSRGSFLGCSGFPKCKNTKPARRTKEGKIELIEVETTDKICDKCGKPMIVKYYKKGRFLSCSDYPKCKNAKSFSSGVACPEPGCGGELIERYSKRGLFFGCSNYPKCRRTFKKLPDTSSSAPPNQEIKST